VHKPVLDYASPKRHREVFRWNTAYTVAVLLLVHGGLLAGSVANYATLVRDNAPARIIYVLAFSFAQYVAFALSVVPAWRLSAGAVKWTVLLLMTGGLIFPAYGLLLLLSTRS